MNYNCWKLLLPTCVAISTTSTFGYFYYKFKTNPSVTKNSLIKLQSISGYADVKKLNEPYNKELIQQTINNLSSAGWCALAVEGNNFFKFFKPKILWENRKKDFSLLLSEIKLDAQWESALKWYLANFCTEEDLNCQETPNSKEKNLMKLLRIIFFKSETDECYDLANENVLSVLNKILNEIRITNKHMTIILLKILSNIASKSKKGAEIMCNSVLLETFFSMINNPAYEEENVLAKKICLNILNSLGVPGTYRLSSSIYELYNTSLDSKPLIDIVFVHGLRGSVFKTWRQRDDLKNETTLFWPKYWLPNDINQPIRILALDYASRLIEIKSVMETIAIRSEKFQKEFKLAGIGDRPVIFICHSMGGLLVKHILLNNKSLLKQTVGILFMSTPHRGSPIASYSYQFLRPSNDIQLLREDSIINQKLDYDFKNIALQIPIFVTILESKKTRIFGVYHFIVPYLSGVFDFGSVYHVNTNHNHVCKPINKEDAIYNIVLNFIKDAILYIKQN